MHRFLLVFLFFFTMHRFVWLALSLSGVYEVLGRPIEGVVHDDLRLQGDNISFT